MSDFITFDDIPSPAEVEDQESPEQSSEEESKSSEEMEISDIPEVKEKEEKSEKKDKEPSEEKVKEPGKEEDKPKIKPSVPNFVNIADKKVTQEELIDSYQQFQSFQSQLEQFNQQKQQLEELMTAAKSDPINFLSHPDIGADAAAIRDRLIKQAIEEESLTPEQKRIRQLEQQLSSQEQEKTKQAEMAKQAEYNRQVDQKRQEIGNILSKAMESSILSSNPELAPEMLKEMAGLLRAAKRSGYSPDPTDLAKRVENKYFTAFSTLANQLEGEELVNFLGNEVVKRLRKFDLQRTKEKKPARVSPESSKQTEPKKTQPLKYVSPWDARL